MKKLLTLIAAMMMCLGTKAFVRSDIQSMLQYVAGNFPMDYGNGMTMLTPTLEGEDIIMTIVVPLEDSMLDMIKDNEADLVGLMANQLKATPISKQMLTACYETKTNIILRYVNDNGKKVELEVPWSMMLVEKEAEPDRTTLRDKIRQMSNDLPTDVGFGMIAKSVTLEGDDLVMEFVMNLDSQILSQFKGMEDELLNSIIQFDETKEIVDLCKDAKCNLVLRYSNYDGDSVDLVLPYTKM